MPFFFPGSLFQRLQLLHRPAARQLPGLRLHVEEGVVRITTTPGGTLGSLGVLLDDVKYVWMSALHAQHHVAAQVPRLCLLERLVNCGLVTLEALDQAEVLGLPNLLSGGSRRQGENSNLALWTLRQVLARGVEM